MTGRRLPGLTALALVAAVGLSACRDDEKKTDDTPCGAPQARDDHLTIQTAVEELRAGGAGAQTQRMLMTATGAGDPITMEGVGESTADDLVSMDITISGDAGVGLRMIYVDDLLYLAGSQFAPAGKFVKVDPNDPKDPLGVAMKPTLDGVGLNDSFAAWETGLKAVRFVADEPLEGGIDAEHYTFVVDARAAFEVQNPGEVAPPTLPDDVTYDVWVDDRNLIRRVESSLAGSTTTITISDYCESIDVEAPNDDEIEPREVR